MSLKRIFKYRSVAGVIHFSLLTSLDLKATQIFAPSASGMQYSNDGAMGLRYFIARGPW